MADRNTKRLILEVNPTVRERLREVAIRRGVSIGELCIAAIERELDDEEVNSTNCAARPYDFDDLFAYRDHLLGDQFFPGNSVDSIREGRALRTIQLEDR